MADYTPPGGRDFGTPDFSDAIPPSPPNQGGMAGVNYTNPTTFESGSVPASTGAIESNWSGLVNTSAVGSGGPVDGYRPNPVGGSYNPGNGNPPKGGGTERSNAS
jgi:hypothetical protein